MEQSSCVICSHMITRSTGITSLPCGHSFHPHCIHNLIKGSAQCPSCPKPTTPLLDFGDNPLIATATRESIYSSASGFSQDSSKRGFMNLFNKRTNYSPYATPEELVNLGAPIQVFRERKIALKDVVKSGVKLAQWFNSGYTLKDLQDIGVQWDDMVYMGLTANDLDKIPASFLTDVLKADIGHLLSIGTSWQHLIQARYSARDLLALKCTTHVLSGLGMEGSQMPLFGFSESEWRALSLQ